MFQSLQDSTFSCVYYEFGVQILQSNSAVVAFVEIILLSNWFSELFQYDLPLVGESWWKSIPCSRRFRIRDNNGVSGCPFYMVPQLESHPEYLKALQWRHNGCGGVSNHQPHDYLLNRLFRNRWKKTSKLRATCSVMVLAFMESKVAYWLCRQQACLGLINWYPISQ